MRPARKAVAGRVLGLSVLASVRVELHKVLDLTDPATLELLGIRREELVSPDWRLTQELGRKIREAGFEAALVPSAATSGTNLALFLDRLQPASSVQLSDLEPIEV